MSCEKNYVALAKTIKSTIIESPHEAGQEDEDSTAKVSRIAQIAQDLKKQVEELQTR